MTDKITVSLAQLLEVMKTDYNTDINQYLDEFKKNTGMTIDILPLTAYVTKNAEDSEDEDDEAKMIEKWVTENKLDYKVIKAPKNIIDFKDVITRYENNTLTTRGIGMLKKFNVKIKNLNVIETKTSLSKAGLKFTTRKVKVPVKQKIPFGLWFDMADSDYYILLGCIDESLHDEYFREYVRAHGIEDLKGTVKYGDESYIYKWLTKKTIVEERDFSKTHPEIKVAHQIKTANLQEALEYVRTHKIKLSDIVLVTDSYNHETMYNKLVQTLCKDEGKSEGKAEIATAISSVIDA